MGQLICLTSPQVTLPGNGRARTEPPELSTDAQLSVPTP